MPQRLAVFRASRVVTLTVVVTLLLGFGLIPGAVRRLVVGELLSVFIFGWTLLGVARIPKQQRRAWLWLVSGVGLWIAGDVGWDWISVLEDHAPTVSLADIPYLLGYPVVVYGVARLLHLRSPRRDREGLIDGFALAVSAFLVAWQFLIVPARNLAAPLGAQFVAAAYPLGDAFILGAIAWLAFAPGKRSASGRYLLLFGFLTFVIDITYSVATIAGLDEVVRLANNSYPFAYLLLGLAVHDRSVSTVTEPVHELIKRTNPARLGILGATLYVAPLLTFARVRSDVGDKVVGVGGTTLLGSLVLARFVLVIREREKMQEETTHRALHDELTGLANRQLLLDRISFAHFRRANSGQSFAVLFLDLDRFKSVNDTWGHAVGNEVLIAVAKSLRRCVRHNDLVARIGGDEFAVLCEDLLDSKVVEDLANRILTSIASDLPKEAKLIGVSIGLAYAHPGDEEQGDPERLLHCADLAMYRAKGDGGSAWRTFDDDLRRWSEERRLIEADLADAMNRAEFYLEFQPIVDIATAACVGFESLLRWKRGGQALVPPTAFIPIAESTGLIVPIGDWVINEAARFASQLREVLPDAYVAVNVSAVQFRRSDVVGTIEVAADGAGAAVSRLVIELTESALATEIDQVDSVLAKLVALGARIAVDDFGTGYSSLAYIARFPISIVKIDKSLIDRVDTDESQQAMVQAVTGLAQSLGFSVVAEGVERDSQRAELMALGVRFGQGWLWAAALPAEIALTFAEQHRDIQISSAKWPVG
jgi:diguanylate cyclase